MNEYMNEEKRKHAKEACDFYNKYMASSSDTPLQADDLEDDMPEDSPTRVSPLKAWQIEQCKHMTRKALSARLGFNIVGSPRTARPRFFGIAAAVLILFGVGIMLTWRDLQPVPQHRLQQLAHCVTDTTITLPDGTRVDLQAGSSLSIADDFGRSSRVVALSGQAFFDVATDSARLFTVEAGQLHAVVHGTSFNVLAHPGQAISEITVSSGCVEVKKAHGGHSFGRYHHGDQIAYDARTARATVHQVDVDDMTEWQRHEFRLTDATRQQFCDKIRRHFGKEIVIRDNAIDASARINYSATAARPTVTNVMNDICVIFNVHYADLGNVIIISTR